MRETCTVDCKGLNSRSVHCTFECEYKHSQKSKPNHSTVLAKNHGEKTREGSSDLDVGGKP